MLGLLALARLSSLRAGRPPRPSRPMALFLPGLLPEGTRAVYFEAAGVIVTLILLVAQRVQKS